MGKDSYKINNQITLDTNCFNNFTYNFENNYKKNSYTILIPNEYNNKLDRKSFKYFLNQINKIIPIKFKLKYNREEEWYELEFILNPNVNYRRIELTYCCMLIRCAYEQLQTDDFSIIAKHFINLCKLKTKIDKSKLFGIACNIYLNEKRYYNSNHILMYGNGCKILSTNEILNNLKMIININTFFSIDKKLLNFKLIDDNYMKIITDNGIK